MTETNFASIKTGNYISRNQLLQKRVKISEASRIDGSRFQGQLQYLENEVD